jgi:rhomboid protease GluP
MKPEFLDPTDENPVDAELIGGRPNGGHPIDRNRLDADLTDEEPIVITGDLLDTTEAEERRDFERGMSPCPPVTLTLIALNVGIFCWEVASGALDNVQALVAAGALDQAHVVRGEYWRLLSSTFLHGGAEHLIGNCLALYILGMACEHALGWWRASAVYLMCGVTGSLASVFIEPGPTVGASGAVFGFMGCIIAYLRRHRDVFYLRDARIGIVLGFWALWQFGTGWFNPRIAVMAHLGGFAMGSICGFLARGPLLDETEAPLSDTLTFETPPS